MMLFLADLSSNPPEPLSTGAMIFGLTCFATAAALFIKVRRQALQVKAANKNLERAEHHLNEAESALQSESQLLLTWRAGADTPERLIGSLHGAARVPEQLEHLVNFEQWLDKESAAAITSKLALLRNAGTAFNFMVKTAHGDVLEADGRVAGIYSTLRFRPLASQHRNDIEDQYDVGKMAKQVERLSGLLDAAPYPVWLRTHDGKLTWVNQAYVEALGTGGVDEILSQNLALVKPESIDRSKADPAQNLIGRARAMRGGGKRTFNIHEITRADDVLCYALDVSGQEEAERELDRYIRAQASTLDKLSTAIAIFGPDQRLRFYNQAYAQLWDLEANYLSTKPTDGEILDILRQRRLLPEQANFKEWRARQLQAYAQTESREDYWYLPDSRSLRVVVEPHPFGGVTYLYDNLTKEYRLETAVNELSEVQRETLDNLADAVAFFGPDGHLRLHNQAFAKLLGKDNAALGGKLHVDDITKLKGLNEAARNAWEDIKFSVTGLESTRREIDGRFSQDDKEYHYRAVPLPDGSALVTLTDVSDAVRAERALVERAEALEAADELKSRILNNVSYEVRTPLNSVIGFAEALSMGVVGKLDGKQADYVAAIRRSSEDLKAILDAIIDLSALDGGQMELSISDVDVEAVLQQAASRYLPVLKRKKLKISIEVASDVTTIRADHDRLEQVLGQLLSNAAGFSPEGGKIKMGARRSGENLQIWVADNGRGIDPDFQPRVFDRFQAKPLPGNHRGPGLGLALVKGFIELHGGEVSLSSKLDRGTTVICTLPMKATPKPRQVHAA